MESATITSAPRINRVTVTAILSGLLLLGVAIATLNYLSPSSNANQNSDTALAYAQAHMVWRDGPTAQSVRIIPLRYLRSTLKVVAPLPVRADVNVTELVHRYGPKQQVAVVILHGTYNSLPPDEGLYVQGDIVVLVDTKSQKVILLTN